MIAYRAAGREEGQGLGESSGGINVSCVRATFLYNLGQRGIKRGLPLMQVDERDVCACDLTDGLHSDPTPSTQMSWDRASRIGTNVHHGVALQQDESDIACALRTIAVVHICGTPGVVCAHLLAAGAFRPSTTPRPGRCPEAFMATFINLFRALAPMDDLLPGSYTGGRADVDERVGARRCSVLLPLKESSALSDLSLRRSTRR